MALDFPTAPTTGQTYAYQGRVWQFNGTGWQRIGAVGPGVKVQTFTASGTYTPSPGMINAIIECVGSGAGGGGVASSSFIGGGGGGGGGSYSRAYVTAAQVGTSQVVTVGNNGTGGTAGGNDGVSGADVSVGTLCVGKGGTKGLGAAANTTGTGGAGGVAGTGDLTVVGAGGIDGTSSTTVSTPANPGGSGGASGFSFGAGGLMPVAKGNGVVGTGYGAGGSGGTDRGTGGNRSGGDGTKGIVVITEFLGTSYGQAPYLNNGFDAPINLGLSASAAGSALTINITDANGNTPTAASAVLIPFRNSGQTTGKPTWRQVSSATSLTISSGSTMGVTSSTAFRIWIVALDNAGTVVLGAVNCSACSTSTCTIYPILSAEAVLQSTTAEGGAGAADSAGIIYTTATQTTLPFRILGFVEWNSSGLTAGTWTTTNMNVIQLFGPGIKKPGDVVQVASTTSSRADTTTSASFVSTTFTQAIQPVSACNPIRIQAAAAGQNTGTTETDYSISRGTVANTNIIGSYEVSLSGAGATCGINLFAWDLPNSASVQTYAVQFRVSGNTGKWGVTSNATIEAIEYMG